MSDQIFFGYSKWNTVGGSKVYSKVEKTTTANGFGSWTRGAAPTGLPSTIDGGAPNSIADHLLKNGYLYVAWRTGLYRASMGSNLQAQDWSLVSSSLSTNRQISDTGTFYISGNYIAVFGAMTTLGLDTGSIRFSSDGGTSWSQITLGSIWFNDGNINGVQLFITGDILYAYGYSGRNADGTNNGGMRLFVYNMSTNTVVYNKIVTSNIPLRGGDSINNLADYKNKFVVLPAAGTSGQDLIYCLAGGGIYKSLNGGNTFSLLSGSTVGTSATTFYSGVAAANANTVFMLFRYSSYPTEYVGLKWSIDGGSTWDTTVLESNSNGVPVDYAFGIVLDAENNNIVYTRGGYTPTTKKHVIDFTNKTVTSSTVTGTHTSPSGSFAVQALATAVSNTTPTNLLLSTSTVAENAGANAVVGTLSTTDAEGGAMTYTLVAGSGDTHNSLFNISGSSLRATSSFDYENMPAGAVGNVLSVRVQATDSGGLSYSKAFNITVSNANESPSNITLSASSITEGNAVGAVIGTLSAIDPDTGDTSFTFSIPAGMGNDKFSVDGNSLKAAIAFDYETAASHSVTVRATDIGGLTYDKAFTITVDNNAGDDPVLASANIVSTTGRVVIRNAANNPTINPSVLSDGSQLPSGSIVIMTDNSKFVKFSGGAGNFLPISSTPPAAWGWSEDGAAAWLVLQNI